jgi:hypothetical protein
MKGISIYVRKNYLRSVVVVVDDFDPRPIYSVVDQMKRYFITPCICILRTKYSY